MPRKDFSQVAFDVMRRATGEAAKPVEPAPTPKQEAGRKGGLKGGAARAIKLTPAKRQEIAVKAAKTRWKVEAEGNSE